jgi:hypothetical protein
MNDEHDHPEIANLKRWPYSEHTGEVKTGDAYVQQGNGARINMTLYPALQIRAHREGQD